MTRSISTFRVMVLVFILAAIMGETASLMFSVPQGVPQINNQRDISLKNEVQHAIAKGLQWLLAQQDPRGFWSQADYPALSALALTAFMGEPGGTFKTKSAAAIAKGYAYLVQCVKPDGGIYVSQLANYNTAVSMMALQVANDPVYEKILLKAHNFILGLQQDSKNKGQGDSLYDGGIGYGDRYDHSDMSNTILALEAIYYTQYLKRDSNEAEDKQLNFPAAIKFIQNCQNLPGYNDQAWVSKDPQDKGGFVYFPGNSKFEEEDQATGKKTLRSYGSISYAGLLSYIYARMDKDDPRVKAAFEWLRRNYTLEENPGMGPQGLYYYYHTMAKTLALYGVNEIVLADGRKVNWRKDMALKLINLQNNNGFWVNENNRWWEKDPVLATSYTIIALDIIYKGL
jgi:squalene-hopene/tetraprenyl-beta-curcumene cyclase